MYLEPLFEWGEHVLLWHRSWCSVPEYGKASHPREQGFSFCDRFFAAYINSPQADPFDTHTARTGTKRTYPRYRPVPVFFLSWETLPVMTVPKTSFRIWCISAVSRTPILYSVYDSAANRTLDIPGFTTRHASSHVGRTHSVQGTHQNTFYIRSVTLNEFFISIVLQHLEHQSPARGCSSKSARAARLQRAGKIQWGGHITHTAATRLQEARIEGCIRQWLQAQQGLTSVSSQVTGRLLCRLRHTDPDLLEVGQLSVRGFLCAWRGCIFSFLGGLGGVESQWTCEACIIISGEIAKKNAVESACAAALCPAVVTQYTIQCVSPRILEIRD